MSVARAYGDSCGAAHAMELVGERWSMLVVRELMLGPKRYGDLRADLPGISTNVLSTRLSELVRTGIVRHTRLPKPAGSAVYELTPWGRELEPVMCQIGRWAARSPLHDTTQHLSVTSFVLSLRANADPSLATGAPLRIQFRLHDDSFLAELADGHFRIKRGTSDIFDAVVSGPPEVMAGIVYGGLPVATAVADELIELTGDEDAFQRFAAAFPLPATASL
ncbi:MAG: hxlR-like helix-turn-helix family protein [Frankiales bacterium]|nr:hxlR-like helix-turn-helix family protein [Frankiales bacterium]